MIKSALSWLWRHIGFVCVAAVLVYCVVHAFDPPRLNWGDSGSDYNVMESGRNFQNYGFLKLRLTPYLLDPAILTPRDSVKIYTHYPQLADLMNGVLRTVFHLSDLTQFRFVALGFSFAALFFIYQLVASYWGRETGQIALALWVVNPLWIQHADYLHGGPYGAFFGYGMAYLLTRYFGDGRKLGYLLGAGGFLYFAYLASYDYWFFAPGMALLVTLWHERGVTRSGIRVLAILAAFATAAVLSKFATNAWVLGGVGGLFRDLRFQLAERTADAGRKVSVSPGVWPTAYGRIGRFFTILLFPIALFWAAVPLFRGRFAARVAELRGRQPNPWWLMLVALPFLCIFVELWVSQFYPTLLVMPFYTVGAAAAILLLVRGNERLPRALAATAFATLLANSVFETVSFKKAFFPMADIRALQAQLDATTRPGQYLLVNHTLDFAYGYYFGHPTIDMILLKPNVSEQTLSYYIQPQNIRIAPPSGAIYVQSKHVADELFDKWDYLILSQDGYWAAWADPERYHDGIAAVVNQRDSVLTAAVSRVGHKIAETDSYILWQIPPRVRTPQRLSSAAPVAR